VWNACKLLTEKIEAKSKFNWVGLVTYVDKTKACNVLVVKPKGKKTLGGTMRTWEDNIRLNLKGIGCEGMNWTYLM
jgi:hypothetical protein